MFLQSSKRKTYVVLLRSHIYIYSAYLHFLVFVSCLWFLFQLYRSCLVFCSSLFSPTCWKPRYQTPELFLGKRTIVLRWMYIYTLETFENIVIRPRSYSKTSVHYLSIFVLCKSSSLFSLICWKPRYQTRNFSKLSSRDGQVPR